MSFRSTARLAWSEHGTWAILWTSFGLGFLASWPPSWITASTFAGLSFLAAAKVLLTPARQGRLPLAIVITLGAVAGLGLLPLLLEAPIPLFALGAVAAPFAALAAWEAKDPKWMRTLGVEAAGIALLASSAGLAVLAARPKNLVDAGMTSLAAAALFLPGVPRARLLKAPSPLLRGALLALFTLGAAFVIALPLFGFTAWWGAFAALSFAADLRAAVVVPRYPARRLGFLLLFRNVAAALILSLAWRHPPTS
jgi:hypothetical protein